jgi:predicted Zn-dependent protease
MLPREHIEALEILGHIYFLQGRAKECRIVFKGLLVLDEGNTSALGHLAALELEEGRGEDALRLLDAYMSGERKASPPVWLMRAQALALAGRVDESRRSMAQYMALAAGRSTA